MVTMLGMWTGEELERANALERRCFLEFDMMEDVKLAYGVWLPVFLIGAGVIFFVAIGNMER